LTENQEFFNFQVLAFDAKMGSTPLAFVTARSDTGFTYVERATEPEARRFARVRSMTSRGVLVVSRVGGSPVGFYRLGQEVMMQ
jgi:hypothetical protein